MQKKDKTQQHMLNATDTLHNGIFDTYSQKYSKYYKHHTIRDRHYRKHYAKNTANIHNLNIASHPVLLHYKVIYKTEHFTLNTLDTTHSMHPKHQNTQTTGTKHIQ